MTSSTTSEAPAARSASRGSGGSSRGSASRGSSRPARKPRKKPLATRASAWLLAHPVIAAVLCTAFLAGAAVLMFWFTNFSGLSSSADFVYSKF